MVKNVYVEFDCPSDHGHEDNKPICKSLDKYRCKKCWEQSGAEDDDSIKLIDMEE